MRSIRAEVVEAARLYGNTHIVWFKDDPLVRAASPGQFVMVYIGDRYDPLLGRAMSIHRWREAESGESGEREWALLFDLVGEGTRWLAERHPGDEVRMVGPLGRGFEPRQRVQHMLLVGGGIGSAPLIWFADELVRQGREVTLVLGGRSSPQIYPPSLLPPAVEVVVATEDGSMGERGLVTAPFERLLPWCDQAFACGPDPMFRALYERLEASALRKPVQGLLEGRMACGFGVCYSCAVFPRRGGVKLVCSDGPMFDLRDLYG